jgi:hypothetical protein
MVMPLNANRNHVYVLAILLSGCGPWVPLSYDRDSSENELTQTIESPDATVILEYMGSQNNFYVFDLEIQNHSSVPIAMAPQNISFYMSPKLFVPIHTDDVHVASQHSTEITKNRQFACSTAQVIKAYQEKVKAKEAGLVIFAILGAGLIVYDAVKDAEDSKKETWTKKDETRAATRDLIVEASLTATRIAADESYRSAEESFYLPYELFPECEIGTGKSKRGKVFISIVEYSYNYARIVVPLQNNNYVFDFKKRGVHKRN